MEEYLVPTAESETEFTEKRSRFIGRIWPVETEEEALAHIKAMREQHWDAKHNVYAYILHGGATRYSDDGEPQGTAGMPVLDVLRKEGLYNVCCVVTRYFGGILLGGGGLVRAYTKSAKLAVDAAGLSMKRVWQNIEIPCPYNLYERVGREITACGGIVTDTEFGAAVMLKTMFPAASADAFLVRLTDLTAAAVQGVPGAQEYRAFPVETEK